MARKKLPWCIEIEFDTETEGDRPSEFYVVRRIVGDAKDLHLMIVDQSDKTSKISFDRRMISRVLMVNSTKEHVDASV